MKITITVELDQEATQMIANPLETISQKITHLIESFAKHDQVIKPTPENPTVPPNVTENPAVPPNVTENPAVPPNVIEEEPAQESAQPQEAAESIPDKKNIKKTILETIKSKKTGIKGKQIQKITGFTGKQISNNIFHLKKEKLVRKTPKGFFVYIPPQETSINSDLDSK